MLSVVDVPSPYNAIMGKPWLHQHKAVPFTLHQALKFPNKEWGIKTIRGDQVSAQQCLMLALGYKEVKLAQKWVCSIKIPNLKVLGDIGKDLEKCMIEELHKIQISLDDPERKIYGLFGHEKGDWSRSSASDSHPQLAATSQTQRIAEVDKDDNNT